MASRQIHWKASWRSYGDAWGVSLLRQLKRGIVTLSVGLLSAVLLVGCETPQQQKDRVKSAKDIERKDSSLCNPYCDSRGLSLESDPECPRSEPDVPFDNCGSKMTCYYCPSAPGGDPNVLTCSSDHSKWTYGIYICPLLRYNETT